MLTITKYMPSSNRMNLATLLLVFVAAAGVAAAQTTASLEPSPEKADLTNKALSTPHKPLDSVYKEVKIGSGADEVRKLLGKATIDDKDGFFYEMDSEMVQIRLDDEGKVRLIAVTYSSESPNVPKYANIFGAEPEVAKPDGSIYKLVRYPEAGYWIAYSKTAGEKPSVIVTMQKL